MGLLFVLPTKTTPKTPNYYTPAPSPAATPQVSLSILEKFNLSKGTKTTLPIILDTAGLEVSAVELRLRFNPEIISITLLNPLEFFENPHILEREIDNFKGEATFILGTREPKSGTGQVAQISLTAKKSGQTEISLNGSQAAALGKQENVIGKITNSLIIVREK